MPGGRGQSTIHMPTQPPIEPRLNPKPPAATDSRSVKAVALATVLLTAIGAAAAMVLHSELQSISATMSTQGETLQRHERRISRIGEKLGSSNRSLRTLVDQADTHERIRERHAAREAEQIRAMLYQLRRLGGRRDIVLRQCSMPLIRSVLTRPFAFCAASSCSTARQAARPWTNLRQTSRRTLRRAYRLRRLAVEPIFMPSRTQNCVCRPCERQTRREPRRQG